CRSWCGRNTHAEIRGAQLSLERWLALRPDRRQDRTAGVRDRCVMKASGSALRARLLLLGVGTDGLEQIIEFCGGHDRREIVARVALIRAGGVGEDLHRSLPFAAVGRADDLL